MLLQLELRESIPRHNKLAETTFVGFNEEVLAEEDTPDNHLHKGPSKAGAGAGTTPSALLLKPYSSKGKRSNKQLIEQSHQYPQAVVD